MQRFRLVCLAVPLFISLGSTMPAALKAATWQQGCITEAFEAGKDRVFVVNRGWQTGQVESLSSNVVAIVVEGNRQLFPRNEVSLVELSDWLAPGRRPASKAIEVRIELDGIAERADFYFGDGTTIEKVNASPAYTQGNDPDDRTGIGPTHIWFDKGNGDRSATVVRSDVTLLPANPQVLRCEVYPGRANAAVGSLLVRFLDPKDGTPLVVMRNPVESLWFKMDVPIAKLSPQHTPCRVEAVTSDKVSMDTIPVIEPPRSSGAKINTRDRVIQFDGRMIQGEVLEMDDRELSLRVSPVGPPVKLSRAQIAFIEIYDWETPLRKTAAKRNQKDTITGPVRIIFVGSSSEGQIELDATDVIEELIMPPHHVTARDFQCTGFVTSDRVIGYRNGPLDRSYTQVEAIARLKLAERPAVKARVSNHYTNVLAGDLQLLMYDALMGTKIWASNRTTQREQERDLKIQRPSLFR